VPGFHIANPILLSIFPVWAGGINLRAASRGFAVFRFEQEIVVPRIFGGALEPSQRDEEAGVDLLVV
jgi:hypothetical protein